MIVAEQAVLEITIWWNALQNAPQQILVSKYLLLVLKILQMPVIVSRRLRFKLGLKYFHHSLATAKFSYEIKVFDIC